jgi:hypothetical protein
MSNHEEYIEKIKNELESVGFATDTKILNKSYKKSLRT